MRQAFDTPMNFSAMKTLRNQGLIQQIDEAQIETKVIYDLLEEDTGANSSKVQQTQNHRNSQVYQQNQVANAYMKMEEEKLKALTSLYSNHEKDQNT